VIKSRRVVREGYGADETWIVNFNGKPEKKR
jgi:hypothetical protein